MTGEVDSVRPAAHPSRLGVLLLGVALAAALGAVAYRSFEAPPSGVEAEDPVRPPSIEELQRRAEASPSDPAGWQELGFARFQRSEFAEAATAYRRATDADPESAVLWSALGEALVMASRRDPLPADALAAFEKARALDPADPRARYFLAVRRDLDGDHEGAISDWLALLAETPPGAPWESDLARTIEQVGRVNGISTEDRLARADATRAARFATAPTSSFSAGAAIPGPSREQIEAARGMSPGQQREMAEGMVASLEAKLRADPKNVEGWLMLMRSRVTLGQTDQARKALADAVAANPADADRLRQNAGALGVR